jgi:hypothetical protein
MRTPRQQPLLPSETDRSRASPATRISSPSVPPPSVPPPPSDHAAALAGPSQPSVHPASTPPRCDYETDGLIEFVRIARGESDVSAASTRAGCDSPIAPSRMPSASLLVQSQSDDSAAGTRDMNRALRLRGPDTGPYLPINKATNRQSPHPRSRSERESEHEHRSPPYLPPTTSRHAERPAPDAAAGASGRAQSTTRTRPPVFERMLANTREAPPTPISCKPHHTMGGTSDPSRSHKGTDPGRRVHLTEASSGKATAAATPRREDGTCEAGAKGRLEHEELMKLHQENQDLRAQLRRQRSGHLTERPRTAGGARGSCRSGGGKDDEDLGNCRSNKDGRFAKDQVPRSPDRSRDCSSKIRMERLPSATLDLGPAPEPQLVDGFEVLVRRYKMVWDTMSHTLAPGLTETHSGRGRR